MSLNAHDQLDAPSAISRICLLQHINRGLIAKIVYREYLKRDDQILPLRLQQEERRNRMTANAKDRDRALAQANPNELPPPEVDMDLDDDVGMDDMGGSSGQDVSGTKIIVIHPGSQNLRIGLASDAIPKTVPMVVARKWKVSESEDFGTEPSPKRLKLDNGSTVDPEKIFGQDVGQSLWYSSCAKYGSSLLASLAQCVPI